MRDIKMFYEIIVFALGLHAHIAHGTFSEQIFKEGTSGKQVVQHAINLIGNMCILDSELFLLRMAYAETMYGTDPDTYRNGYHGGIWQIDEDAFKSTQNRPNLQSVYDVVKKKIYINWSNITWHDLRKPIYSGVAATLFLLSRNITSISHTVDQQAMIWSTFRSGNSPMDFLFKAGSIDSNCSVENKLDLMIVIDFVNLSVWDLSHIRSFIAQLLQSFTLNLNATRVGLVTKKQYPVAGWYLNSQKPGYTLLNALPGLRYVAGPTTTGDSLYMARTSMFVADKGARTEAKKFVLLLTDEITQPIYAKNESMMLRNAGIPLMIVEVETSGNSTSKSYLDFVVGDSSCRHSKVVKSFEQLVNIYHSIVAAICSAPLIIVDGHHTYPCTHAMSAILPDSTNSVSVKVSGDVDLFASNAYMDPDNTSHEFHIQSNNTKSAVLYVRGTDPMYIRVQSRLPASCVEIYSVEIKSGNSFTGENGTCIIAGTSRTCTDTDMESATRDIILQPDYDHPYICTSQNRSIEYFPHQLDPQKFIMCDANEHVFVGLCPANQVKCTQATSGCRYTNPCVREDIISGRINYNDPCGEMKQYVTCSRLGFADIATCPPSRVWNHDTLHCVYEHVRDPLSVTNKDDMSVQNPCIHSHENHVYFPYPRDPSKYILCDVFGNAFVNTCKNGGLWNEQTKSCALINPIVG